MRSILIAILTLSQPLVAEDFAKIYRAKPKQALTLYSTADGKKIRARTESLQLSSDGAKLLVGESSKDLGSIALWNLSDKTQIWTQNPSPKGTIEVRFLNSEKWAASLGREGIVTVFDGTDGKSIRSITLNNDSARARHGLATLRSQTLLAMTTLLSNPICRVLELQPTDAELLDQTDFEIPGDRSPHALALSPDGTRIAASANRTIRISQRQNPEKFIDLTNMGGEAISLAMSDTLLASGHDIHDKRIRLWNPESGELLKTVGEYTAGVSALELSKDGRFLFAAGSQQTYNLNRWTPVDIWDTTTGEIIQSVKIPSLGDPRISMTVTSLALNADGTRLAVGIFDAGDGFSHGDNPPDITPSVVIFDFPTQP